LNPLLEIRKVTVRFGGITAVDQLSLRLNPGELLGFIGPNGAGKTTVMRAITGMVKPQSGQILLAGHALNGLAIHQRIRLGLGLAQQIVSPFRSMSVLENVALACGHRHTRQPLRALFKSERRKAMHKARDYLDLVGIAHWAHACPTTLPLGGLKRLELARALALEPKLMLLDEPLAGLNQQEAQALANTIAELNREGLSIILIEHNLGQVRRICPRLLVQDNGRKLADGITQTVLAEPAVQAAYLGQERSC